MISKYGLNWPDNTIDLQIEMAMIRKGGQWEEKGITYGLGNSHHYEQIRKILWPHLDAHRWHNLCRDEVLRPNTTVTVLMGPGSCVAGHTKIPNPLTGELTSIEDLHRSQMAPVVMTLIGPKMGSIPTLKGRSVMVEVVLKNGSRFTATPDHLVLTDGGFRCVSSLQIGQYLFSYGTNLPVSTSEPYPKECLASDQRSFETIQDSQSGYPACFHSCDELLPMELGIFSGGPPLLSDAPVYIRCPSHSDDLSSLLKYTRPYPQSDHPSNSDVFHEGFHIGTCKVFDADSEMLLHAAYSSRQRQRSSLETFHRPANQAVNPYALHNFQNHEWAHKEYGVLASAVQEINQLGESDYYDIQVPEAHHYFADGVIHHNSGKTHESAWIYLVEYFCFPHETCVLVSSTDIRGLRLRVWGEITMLWEMATKRYDFLPGNLLDSKLAITTDSLDDGDLDDRSVRDMRKGIVGIPTVQNGKFIGLGKWVGIKQKRVRLIADEASMMGTTFLSAFANLNKNENFQAIVLGNPNDPLDPLGKAAEPKEGWTEEYLEPEKTRVWDTRFMNGRCVNLIGLDSPNMDFPANEPTRYKYLISRKKIDETLSFFPKDSVEYYSQCVGSMKIGTMARRVVTRDLCRKFGALEQAVWLSNASKIRIASLDSAYGGDRCILTTGEFGTDIQGKQIIHVDSPIIVPVSVKSTLIPEDQISNFCREHCERNNIPPDNFFHDSTGRGTLGTSLARIWSAMTNPVEFGGSPTERPVSLDLYVYDAERKERRLKLAKEHYSKFVTELWFSVRYAIEAGQIRNLSDEVIEEGSMREWKKIKGDKIELETKADMKERVGRSPDLFDSLAILIEGARRRGFQISKLANNITKSPENSKLHKEAHSFEKLHLGRQLQNA